MSFFYHHIKIAAGTYIAASEISFFEATEWSVAVLLRSDVRRDIHTPAPEKTADLLASLLDRYRSGMSSVYFPEFTPEALKLRFGDEEGKQ